MKRKMSLFLVVLIMCVALVFTGCNSTPSSSGAPAASLSEATDYWKQDYILAVDPIMMRDPFMEVMGQIDGPIPYYYYEAAKLAGHSCGAISGAWTMTRKALEVLYPGDEVPVRGHIKIQAPGPADQYYLGVFGEVFTYITGASEASGFPGSSFGEDFNRRYLLEYPEEKTDVAFPAVKWIFERKDTGKKVSVQFNLMMVQPPSTPDRQLTESKLASGDVPAAELADWQKYWNARAKFVLDNADKIHGFFIVDELN